MTDEQCALRDAYLRELWPVCREVPAGERQAKRQADWEQRIYLADLHRKSTPDAPMSA